MFWGRGLSDVDWGSRCCYGETSTDNEPAEDEHPYIHGCGLEDGADESYNAGPEDGFSSASPVDEETGWESGDGS